MRIGNGTREARRLRQSPPIATAVSSTHSEDQGRAHNHAAALSIAETLALTCPGQRWHLVFGALATKEDLRKYHAMLLETTDLVRTQMKAGKSPDEIKKAGLPDRWKTWGEGFIPADRWIDTIYTYYSQN